MKRFNILRNHISLSLFLVISRAVVPTAFSRLRVKSGVKAFLIYLSEMRFPESAVFQSRFQNISESMSILRCCRDSSKDDHYATSY